MSPTLSRHSFVRLLCTLPLPLLLSGLLSAAGGPDTPQAPDWASFFTAKLERLKTGTAGSGVTFGQHEITAFLNRDAERLFRGAARDIRVTVHEGGLRFQATANLERAGLVDNSTLGRAFRWVFAGDHPVDILLRLHGAEGQATITVESLQIKGVTMPSFLVESLGEQLGRRQDPPFRFGQPQPLPWNVERLSCLRGMVTIQVKAPTR